MSATRRILGLPPRGRAVRRRVDRARRKPAGPQKSPFGAAVTLSAALPDAGPAVSRLMSELDAVKAELSAARMRVGELENIADEDPLVPVLNRRGFARELDRSIAYIERYGTSAGLVYIDIDNFKAINDGFGHAAGDAALGHLAELLLANTRKSDIVGRLGGDEFAVILQRAHAGHAAMKAGRLEKLVSDTPLAHDGHLIRLAITTGTAGLNAKDQADDALARADRDMYSRKRPAPAKGAKSDAPAAPPAARIPS